MTNALRVFNLVALVAAHSAAASAKAATIHVVFEGKPLAALHLIYWDSAGTDYVRAVTNADGRGVLAIVEPPNLFDLSVDVDDPYSSDFVIKNADLRTSGIHVVAARGYSWQVRTTPRICDELARTRDIVRGGLHGLTASEYNEWYASLSSVEVSHCETITAIQRKVGSLAPWYLYEFKALEQSCEDGRLVVELDWTAWYRSLLEESTGAKPGKCKADWERWWKAKGYPRVPDPPQPERTQTP